MSVVAKGLSVTFTPVYKGRFLFVQRNTDDPVLGGYWCFPGGKVEVGETLAGTIERECAEEIGLTLTGQAFFVDSYLLGERVGVHFAVEVSDDAVHLDELQDSAWVKQLHDLQIFSPRIPGIDMHLRYIIEQMDRLQRLQDATSDRLDIVARELCWRPLSQFDLVEHRFLNR